MIEISKKGRAVKDELIKKGKGADQKIQEYETSYQQKLKEEAQRLVEEKFKENQVDIKSLIEEMKKINTPKVEEPKPEPKVVTEPESKPEPVADPEPVQQPVAKK